MEYTLGIDIGTSKAASVIIDESGSVVAHDSRPHDARLHAPKGHAEYDALQLIQAALESATSLPEAYKSQVTAIGVTGQMHGIILLDDTLKPVTPLINWQDQRCSPQFLDELKAQTGENLKTGYGGATLTWLMKHQRLPHTVASSGTIHDMLVAVLVGAKDIVMDPTDAASWGFFDLASKRWNLHAIEDLDIQPHILPKVVESGSVVGSLTKVAAAQLGMQAGIPVYAAIGDNQASLMATLSIPETQIALTLGTGGQISVVLPAGSNPADYVGGNTCEIRPYPGGRYAVVAAPLCGGSAWAWLADVADSWLRELGLTPPDRTTLYKRLNELGSEATESELIIAPSFLGERDDPSRRGAIWGINLSNLTLGNTARALSLGIMENFRSMMPEGVLKERRSVVCSGNALRKNPLLVSAAEKIFGLPLNPVEGFEEAATGAALLARETAKFRGAPLKHRRLRRTLCS